MIASIRMRQERFGSSLKQAQHGSGAVCLEPPATRTDADGGAPKTLPADCSRQGSAGTNCPSDRAIEDKG